MKMVGKVAVNVTRDILAGLDTVKTIIEERMGFTPR